MFPAIIISLITFLNINVKCYFTSSCASQTATIIIYVWKLLKCRFLQFNMQVDYVCLGTFVATEFNKLCMGRSLHQGVKIFNLSQLEITHSWLTWTLTFTRSARSSEWIQHHNICNCWCRVKITRSKQQSRQPRSRALVA